MRYNRSMSKGMDFEINQEDLREIYGEDYDFFEREILSNCHCTQCDSPYTSTIVNFKTILDENNDLVLQGFCADCGGPVNRSLETSEVPKYQPRIQRVRSK